MLSRDEAQEMHGRIGAALENFKHMPAGYTAAQAGTELAPILERALELAAIIVHDAEQAPVLAEGPLDWRVEDEGSEVYLQVDGNDVVTIGDVGDDGTARIWVWASSHPDADKAWEGVVNVRERKAEEDPDA